MNCLNYNLRSGDNHSGFTIIEMIVYVAILALILVGVFQMLIAVSSTFNELRATRQLNRSASVVLDRFVREVRDAESIVITSSTFNVHPSELLLDYGNNLPQVRIYLDEGTVKLDRGGLYEGDLTVPGVTVSSFVLRHINVSSVSEGVRLEIALDSAIGTGSAVETFYATAVVRGGY